MARGYERRIGADTRDFERAVKDGVIKPVEDAARSLDDLGDAGRDGGRDAAQGIDQAETSAGKLEAALRDAQKQSEKTERAVKDIGDGSRASFDRASDNVASFKDEAVQNFSEVASSFSGDIEDMADGVQGLTGGLATALTPGIGIPLAVLGAAAAAFLNAWTQSTADTKERVDEMYDDMIESGERFLSEDFINTKIAEIGKEQWDTVQARQRETGADAQTILRAMAGDQAAISELIGEQYAKHQKILNALEGQEDGSGNVADQIDAANVKYEASIEWLQQIARETDTAAAKAKLVGGAMRNTGEDAEEAAGKAKELADAIPESTTIKLSVDDREVRNYRPPVKSGAVIYQAQGNVKQRG